MRKLTHDEILERQKLRSSRPRHRINVVLNNVRSLYNVGSIFRTADGAGIEKMYLCGITGCPPNNMIAKTALGAEQSVSWEHREDAREVVEELKSKGYQIILLEQTESSISYEDFIPAGPVCLVLGHECGGVEEDIAGLCDAAVEIGMDGIKNSLNVAVAFGIVVYQLRHKIKKGKD